MILYFLHSWEKAYFFANLDNLVATKGPVVFLEAVGFEVVDDSVQHTGHIVLRAVGELVVVESVAGRRRSEHDVVSFLAPWTTMSWVVVL